MEVRLIKATRPNIASRGLITTEFICPRWVWTEFLTHKRASRNASSNRAMGVERAIDISYYTPPVFYTQGDGMQSSDIPIENQAEANRLWKLAYEQDKEIVRQLKELKVAKEQANRIFGSFQNIKGLATFTEAGWQAFFDLRLHKTADGAMQELAENIYEIYFQLQENPNLWNYSNFHVPFITEEIDENNFVSLSRISGAKCARISYNRPKNTKRTDDELADDLLDNKTKKPHASCFEHQARWEKNPYTNCLASVKTDFLGDWGWSNYRSILEHKWETEMENKYASQSQKIKP